MGYKLKRIMMWVNNATRGLPAEYQEVEYIQSSGSQYIDTGWYPTGSSELEFEFEYQSGSGTGSFGVDSGWTVNAFSVFTDRILCYGNQYQNNWSDFQYNTKYKLEFKNLTGTLNGVQRFTYTQQSFTSSYSAYVFAKRRNNSIEMYAKIKIYALKLWNSGTLERDFVPCYRKSDNVIGMYDLVNDVFYTNNGSGTFTKGNNVPDMVEKQVRPPIVPPAVYEISYDLKGGNLADLQAAGFDELWTNGGYSFTSDGLQQTSSSNDRGIWIIKRGLDLTNAKKLIAYSVGRWKYASWSNGKEVRLGTAIPSGGNMTSPRRDTYFTYSNNSGYRNSELPYVNASGTSTVLARGIATSTNGADDTITLTIDFENKTIEWKVTGNNNYTLSANLTDEQYNATRNMTAIYWGRGRGFHTYDSYERLKEVHLKIEY